SREPQTQRAAVGRALRRSQKGLTRPAAWVPAIRLVLQKPPWRPTAIRSPRRLVEQLVERFRVLRRVERHLFPELAELEARPEVLCARDTAEIGRLQLIQILRRKLNRE